MKYYLRKKFCTKLQAKLPTRMRAIIQQTAGGSADQLTISEVPMPIVHDDEVLMKVHAFGINRADILQRQGRYPPPKGVTSIMGLECSGYLIEEGEINLSKRVMAIVPGGGYGEYVAVKKNHVIPVPESIDLTDAAAIPEAWITAYQLCKIADIKKDDFVLIHAAASGVGTALIQLINLYKGNSICIVSNNEKLHLCQQLGQGSVHGMLRKELNRINSINNVTDHKNCSVIFDCVGASEFNHNIEAAALDCRWVCYGFLGGSKLAEFDMAKLMSKRINMFYTTLRNRTDDYKAELTKNFIEEILPKFASKELSTVIDTVYEGVENIKAAHHKMEHNLNKGKLIVKWH